MLEVKTLSTFAKQVGVGPSMFASKAELLAIAKWIAYLYGMRNSILRICTEVTNKQGRLKKLEVFFRCDETPLKLASITLDTMYGLPEHVVSQAMGKLTHDLEKDAGVTKLLQSEYIVCVLAKVHDILHLYSWQPPVPVQALGRATSESYIQATMLSE